MRLFRVVSLVSAANAKALFVVVLLDYLPPLPPASTKLKIISATKQTNKGPAKLADLSKDFDIFVWCLRKKRVIINFG